jgi:foldase protein PrsA
MRRAFLALFSAAVLLGACGESGPGVAATVAGEEITVAQVNEARERFEKTEQFDQLTQQLDPATARRRFEQVYLSRLVRRAVLRPQAEKLGIEVTDQEVQERIDQFKAQFPSETEFEKAVEQQGVTIPELEDLVRDSILEEELRAEVTKGVGPSEEELRDYYSSHRAEYRETRAQHILVEDIEAAQRISNELQRAPARRVPDLFAELAKKSSTDTSNKDNAGKLGWVAQGDLAPDFEIAMDTLSVNEVSDPVPTQFGVHVILVTGRRQRPFEAVSQEIEAQLSSAAQEETYTDFLKEAFAQVDVELDPRYGEIDPETLQVVNASAEQVPGADESTPSG